jgi:hypothetical protein
MIEHHQHGNRMSDARTARYTTVLLHVLAFKAKCSAFISPSGVFRPLCRSSLLRLAHPMQSLGNVPSTGQDAVDCVGNWRSSLLVGARASILSSLSTPWKRNTLLVLVAVLACGWAVLYLRHHQKGLQRMIQFWSSVTPWIIEYKFLPFKHKYVDRLNANALQQRMAQFHRPPK